MPNWDHPSILRTATCAVCALALCAPGRADMLPSTSPTAIKSSNAPASPATEPAVVKQRQPMSLPKKYEILLTRSIFAHRRGPGQNGGDAASEAQAHKPGLVLRGVADQEGQRTALLEDTASGKTRQLHVGDEALGGRIVAITMEGLDRMLGGSVLHLGIGQSLEAGGAVAGATTQQGIALENVTPGVHEPSPGSAMPAAATILETPR